jgi:LacI family transcriptional regulator
LRLHHLDVPRNISLIGYDDTHAVRNERRQNILTTIQSQLTIISHETVWLFLDILDGREPPDTHWTLPAKLIVRALTAPPRFTGPLTVI